MNLREQYFEALKQSQRKQLVSKSAIGPDIYAIRDSAGNLIGFAPGERLSPGEIADLKTEVAKSAATDDPNSVLDSLFDFGGETTEVVEIAKSVEVESDNPNLARRFIFVTGDALNSQSQQFFEQTGAAYLRKPFRLDDLLHSIEAVIGS